MLAREDSDSGYVGFEDESRHRKGVVMTKEQLVYLIETYHHRMVVEVHRMQPIPRGYNNVVYEVHVTTAGASHDDVLQPLRMAIRLSNAVTWPPEKVRNEAAALRYIKANTTIPVPEVYFTAFAPASLYEPGHHTTMPTSQQDDADPTLCWHVLAMEWMEGIVLAPKSWERLSATAQQQCAQEFVHVLKELQQLKFDAIGALVPATTAVFNPGEGEEVPPPTALRVDSFLDESERTAGPFPDVAQWLSATLEHYIARNRSYAASTTVPNASCVAKLAEYEPFVRDLLQRALVENDAALQKVPIVATHGDLCARNILFRERTEDGEVGTTTTVISAVLDWEWFHAAPATIEWKRGFDDLPVPLEQTIKDLAAEGGDEILGHGPSNTTSSSEADDSLSADHPSGTPALDALFQVIFGDAFSPWMLMAHFETNQPLDDLPQLVEECVDELEQYKSRLFN